MYANLLAAAMDKETAELAHPGFVEVLRQLTPDEARLVRALRLSGIPILRLKAMDLRQGNTWFHQEEVTLLGEQAGCDHPGLVWSYLTNIERLGLLRTDPDHFISDEMYEPLESSAQTQAFREMVDATNASYEGFMAQYPDGVPDGLAKPLQSRLSIERRRFLVTPFGVQFIRACVLPAPAT
jgi:Abortive infection alpha